jgi:hypothetical protein
LIITATSIGLTEDLTYAAERSIGDDDRAHPHKLIVVRRDRLGGLAHEYEQAA